MKKSKGFMLKGSIAAAAVLLSLHSNAVLAATASNVVSVSIDKRQQSQETDRLIVRYRDNAKSRKSTAEAGLAKARIHAAVKARGLVARELRTNGLGAQIWVLDKRMNNLDLQAMARAIAAADPDVEYAEPDRIVYPVTIPNDEKFSMQWNLHNTAAGINAPGAWAYGITGAGVVVGVVDTGYLPHFDLAANILPGYDFVDESIMTFGDGDGRDPDAREPGGLSCTNTYWHGTHVGATIAGVANNEIGFAGVAYGAKILPLRALGCTTGYESDAADAMLWGAGIYVPGLPYNPTPARVLNLSFGRADWCSSTHAGAVNAVRGRGVVVVAAAGNNASNNDQFTPASCPGVISVAATDESGQKASFSNTGATVSLAAPGTNILSASNTGTFRPEEDMYSFASGTSQAAPHVAGVAALILQARPTLSGAAVEYILKTTTKPFPYGCYKCGSGIVDAQAAVAKALSWSTTIMPDNIVKTRSGTGALSTSATVEPVGVAPFTYAWSVTGDFSLYNAASPTVQVSTYLEVCGRYSTTRQTGTLKVVVTDSRGMVTEDTAALNFSASISGGTTMQCM